MRLFSNITLIKISIKKFNSWQSYNSTPEIIRSFNQIFKFINHPNSETHKKYKSALLLKLNYYQDTLNFIIVFNIITKNHKKVTPPRFTYRSFSLFFGISRLFSFKKKKNIFNFIKL